MKKYIIPLLLFAVVNVAVLDYVVLRLATNRLNVLGETIVGSACPKSCVDKINSITGTAGATAKEYFVPLGAGTNNSADWTDVAGASSYVDTTQYPKIKKVVFEATVAVPTGNQTVFIRLFNVTDKHPVWFSDVTISTTGPLLLTSSPITLDSGNKLYQVQMKTQLKHTANLSQSRIHITTY